MSSFPVRASNAAGVVSGTPSNTGSFSVPVQVTDDGGNSNTTTLGFNISGPTATILGFSSGPNLGAFQQGLSRSFDVTPTGGTPPYTVTALSPLPLGFVLQSGDRPELRASAEKLIDEVVAVQEPSGYLNTYYQDDRKEGTP